MIPGHLSFKGISVSLFPGSLTIRELMLEGHDKTTVLDIPRLSVDFSVRRLLKGEFHIPAVQADGARLDLHLDESGRLNLLSALADPALNSGGKKEGPLILPMNIRIDQVRLSKGILNFKMAEEKVDASAVGLDLSLTRIDLPTLSAVVEIGMEKGRFQRKEDSIEISPFLARADISGEKLSNISIRTAVSGMDLDLSGAADQVFTEPVLDLTLKSLLDLDALKKWDKAMDLPSGTAVAEIWVKGALRNPEAGLSISYGPGGFRHFSIERLNLQSVLKDRVLTLLPSRLESGFGNFQVAGTIDLKEAFAEGFFSGNRNPDQIRYEVTINQDRLDLSTLSLLQGKFKGDISSDLVLKGKGVFPGRIKADISMGLKAKAFIGHPLYPAQDVRVNLNAGLDGYTADIPLLDIRSGDMNLTGKGHLTMPGFDLPSMTVSGQLQFDAAHPAWLENFVPIRVKGPVSLTATVDGNLLNPTAVVALDGKDIEVEKNRIGDVTAALKISKGILDIDQAEISNQNSRLGIHGRIILFDPDSPKISFHPKMDLVLAGDRIFLEDMIPTMKGRIRLQGKITGNPETLSGDLDIKGKDLLIYGQKIEAVSALASLRQKTVEIRDISIIVAEASRIEASGRISLEAQTLDMAMKAEDFDLTLIPALRQQNVQNANLSLDAKATGRLENPVLAGNIHIRDIRVADHAMAPVDLRFDLENQELSLKGKAGPVLEGRYHLGTGELRADLRMEDSFTAGNLTVKSGTLFVKGKAKGPVLYADLSFQDLTVSLDDMEQEFHGISGQVRVTPEKLEILQFIGSLDGGRIDLSGSVGLTAGSLNTMDLKLNAQHLPLNIPDTMELTLDSRLTLQGTREKSGLSGDIILLEGRYYKDVDLVTTVTQKRRKIEPPPLKKENPFLDGMAINVHIRSREPFLVDNNMAYLELSPDLAVRGTARTPVLAGRAVADAGTINFHKSEFDVKKGSIDFINPYKTEPAIHMEGEMNIRSWTIYLVVSGLLDNLDIQLYSSPSESHGDIISLIAFGKTTQEMGKVQEDGQAASGRFVSGLLADALQKNLKQVTGMDQLEIKVDGQAVSGSQAVHVTVGKDLSRQMGVTYDVDTRDGNTVQRVSTFYKLMENLLLRGYQDSGGKIGGELKYRLEFR
jgi:translocation and assembly module TamB